MLVVFSFSFPDLRSDLILVWALICKSLFSPNSLSLLSYLYFIAEHRPCWSRHNKHCSWVWWPHPSLTLLATGLGDCRKSRWWQRWTQGQRWWEQVVPHSGQQLVLTVKGQRFVQTWQSRGQGWTDFFSWHPCVHFLTGPDAAQIQVKLRETPDKATETGLVLCIFFLKCESSTEPISSNYWIFRILLWELARCPRE